jgi:hypothetical protein
MTDKISATARISALQSGVTCKEHFILSSKEDETQADILSDLLCFGGGKWFM